MLWLNPDTNYCLSTRRSRLNPEQNDCGATVTMEITGDDVVVVVPSAGLPEDHRYRVTGYTKVDYGNTGPMRIHELDGPEYSHEQVNPAGTSI